LLPIRRPAWSSETRRSPCTRPGRRSLASPDCWCHLTPQSANRCLCCGNPMRAYRARPSVEDRGRGAAAIAAHRVGTYPPHTAVLERVRALADSFPDRFHEPATLLTLGSRPPAGAIPPRHSRRSAQRQRVTCSCESAVGLTSNRRPRQTPPRNTGKTPGADALFSCPGSGEPDSSYV
jgi:hypothetical protein